MCTRIEATRALEGPTLILYVYLTALAMKGIVHERQFVMQIAKVKFNVMFLVVILWFVCYGAVSPLSYERVMDECNGHETFLCVLIEIVDEWFGVVYCLFFVVWRWIGALQWLPR